MVTESMGPIYDRTQEQLGTSDKAIIRMRRLLLARPSEVAAGGDAARRGRRPGLPQHPVRGEDPRSRARTGACLGTDDDPLVRETDPDGRREPVPQAGD